MTAVFFSEAALNQIPKVHVAEVTQAEALSTHPAMHGRVSVNHHRKRSRFGLSKNDSLCAVTNSLV